MESEYDGFQWDEEKRDANLTNHEIDFQDAGLVFDDVEACTVESLRNGEPRFKTTGMLNQIILAVVWISRDGQRRIISARRASKKERTDYGKNKGR